jgi:hypothetical protein
MSILLGPRSWVASRVLEWRRRLSNKTWTSSRTSSGISKLLVLALEVVKRKHLLPHYHDGVTTRPRQWRRSRFMRHLNAFHHHLVDPPLLLPA